MHAAQAAVVLLLILFSTPLHANVVAPTIYDQVYVNYGTPLNDFTYALSVDCTAGTISIIVMDSHEKPVEGAQTYLQYADISSSLIAAGQTDEDGYRLDRLPGKSTLMHGVFSLTIEKTGFNNMDVDFDISGCYSNGTLKQPAPPSAANVPPGDSSTRPASNTTPLQGTPTGVGQNGNGSGGTSVDLSQTALLVTLFIFIIAIWYLHNRKH